MRTMARNRQVFYSAELLGTTMPKDSEGNYTEEQITYSVPTMHKAVITPASGRVVAEVFSAAEHYDKVITLNQNEDYLKVGSILWVDTMPELNNKGETTTPYDYIVVSVSKSLNFINVAIRKVDVS